MEQRPRRISVVADSPLALMMKDAAAAGVRVEVDTGNASYLVDVHPVITPPQVRPLRRLARHLAGSLAHVDIPGWESSEAAERWVDDLRKVDTYPLDPASHP